MSNTLRIILCIFHGVLFFFTIIAAMHLSPIISPEPVGYKEITAASLFGLLTGFGVLLSWVISIFLYHECEIDEGPFILGATIHSAVIAGLLYAWITYIPMLMV